MKDLKKNKNDIFTRLIVLFALVTIIISGVYIYYDGFHNVAEVVIKPVNAHELFDMFECSCCGSPISKGCCGMANDRQSHITQLIAKGLNRGEVIDKYIRKYGLESVLDADVKAAYVAELKTNAPKDAPIISISENMQDLGEISAKNGVVEISFEFKNEGQTDLIINRLDTSCGCTSAALVINGEESPRFNMSMHGDNPTDYEGIVNPGQSAQIKVYYDPNVHEGMTGSVTRFVNVFSNDPVNFETKVTIKLNQTP